jgi:hypothetical protein
MLGSRSGKANETRVRQGRSPDWRTDLTKPLKNASWWHKGIFIGKDISFIAKTRSVTSHVRTHSD